MNRKLHRALRGRIWLCTLAFGLATASAQDSSRSDLDISEIVKRSSAGVVFIEAQAAKGKSLVVGSGFIVNSAGLVVSSLHVFEDATGATIKLQDGTVATNPRVEAIDRERDLIVLRINASGLRVLPLGRRDTVRPGAKIIVIGNPEGLSGTVSDGIVSAVRAGEAGNLYQITAPVSPGSSGGPVLNLRGEVIGVIAFTMRSGQNLNFAVPVEYILPMLEQHGSFNLSELPARLGKSEVKRREKQPAITASQHYRRGLNLYQAGTTNEAVAEFKKAIAADPGRAEAYFQVGSILANELQSRDQAINYLEQGLKISPEDSVAHSLLSVLYRQDRRYNDSIAESHKAVALSPANPAFHLVLGITLAETQRHEEAIAEFRQAIQLRRGYALAYYHLALSYEKVNNREAAAQAWQSFLKLATKSRATSDQVRTANEHLKLFLQR